MKVGQGGHGLAGRGEGGDHGDVHGHRGVAGPGCELKGRLHAGEGNLTERGAQDANVDVGRSIQTGAPAGADAAQRAGLAGFQAGPPCQAQRGSSPAPIPVTWGAVPIDDSLDLHSYGATDVGRRRDHNEDAFLCDDDLGLWVVADGMGGHAAGEVASQEAIDTIFGMVTRGKRTLELHGDLSEEKARAARRLLEGAVQAATYIIFAIAELDPGKAGMGTTISAMMRAGNYAVLAQVGDSRIYRVRSTEVTQLTEDHTMVAWQLKQGLITPEEAKRSKQRNVITRAVGNRDYVQVDTVIIECELGDLYLLCSDGLHGYLRSEELPELVAVGGGDAVKKLIKLANRRGGKDNITAVLVEVC